MVDSFTRRLLSTLFLKYLNQNKPQKAHFHSFRCRCLYDCWCLSMWVQCVSTNHFESKMSYNSWKKLLMRTFGCGLKKWHTCSVIQLTMTQDCTAGAKVWNLKWETWCKHCSTPLLMWTAFTLNRSHILLVLSRLTISFQMLKLIHRFINPHQHRRPGATPV